ncbi:PEPxxWA-CTERM sorting domain-containing protein [uncultured Phenylobacterium sp.]|uniref:PEPxxWA-CTERM sorting domain-containing protein n=1 Tax=uncultured Phenylobacterium sp. TaxID=349273 RepID=UPI0025E87B27|nr:PEPxxWA-CTERM sorting domain-containing protein [uncultured Phenylobacterium sp.]
MTIRLVALGAFVAALAQPAAAIELFAYSGSSPVDGVFDWHPSEATTEFTGVSSGVTLNTHGKATLGDAGIVLRADASASGTLTTTHTDEFVLSYSLAGFRDHIVISSDGLTGSSGTILFQLDYDGILAGLGGDGGGYGTSVYAVVCEDYIGCSDTSPQSQLFSLDQLYGVSDDTKSVDDSASIGLQFTFGTPFDATLYLGAAAGVLGAAGSSAGAISDFAHTATLGPARVLDANGRLVGGATVSSTDSDYSYAVAVPEPATWALMIGGFGLAGASLRRRRAVAA